jgi:hypothetical protein
MCKSQNRNKTSPTQPAVMLMPDELHNWLLFMALKACHKPYKNGPLGLCPTQSRKRFSIPQAFPQPDPLISPRQRKPNFLMDLQQHP